MKVTNKALVIIAVVALGIISYISLEGIQNFTFDRDISKFDYDKDGIVDAIDAFDKNPEEWDDFDFDGIGANEDTDDDNDGILDINDSTPSPTATQLTMKYLDLIENCAIMDQGLPREFCYRDFFVSLVEKGEDSTELINVAFFFTKYGLMNNCHSTAHHIGLATFQKNPDLTENMMNAQITCRAGFYHGLLSAYFDDLKKEGTDISNLYKTICDEFVGTEHYIRCLHGIGHGLVLYYDDLKSSIDACHELTEVPDEYCMNGVMMQYTENELTNLRPYEEVIPEMCSKIEMTITDRLWCYKKMGQIVGFRTNHDVTKSIELCGLIPDIFGQRLCNDNALDEIADAKWLKTPEAFEILKIPFN